MTGYGKAECICGNNKITVEIRSVNSKNSDISLKTQIIPREKEIEVRQLISSVLQRGNIDLFTTVEAVSENSGRTINNQIFTSYLKQLSAIAEESGESLGFDKAAEIIMRLPDVVETQKKDKDNEDQNADWIILKEAVQSATEMLVQFRQTEGKRLEEDIISRINLIISYLIEIEKYENERSVQIKERIKARLEEITTEIDTNRLEQELIYYLEKLDITEEKVRLKQHCSYFLETMTKEEYPGKKLGFISQEIGREINTLGSKASHAGIQKWVVMMKDELEKIKEQVLNVL
jgi:uncharacterized protein (TIGR00255 family)